MPNPLHANQPPSCASSPAETRGPESQRLPGEQHGDDDQHDDGDDYDDGGDDDEDAHHCDKRFNKTCQKSDSPLIGQAHLMVKDGMMRVVMMMI